MREECFTCSIPPLRPNNGLRHSLTRWCEWNARRRAGGWIGRSEAWELLVLGGREAWVPDRAIQLFSKYCNACADSNLELK